MLNWVASWATLVAWVGGFVSDGGQIVAWVTWVYNILAWVYKFLTWVGLDPKFEAIQKFHIGWNVQAGTKSKLFFTVFLEEEPAKMEPQMARDGRWKDGSSDGTKDRTSDGRKGSSFIYYVITLFFNSNHLANLATRTIKIKLPRIQTQNGKKILAGTNLKRNLMALTKHLKLDIPSRRT